MKKKILTALIVLVMVLSVCATIVACGGKTIKVIDDGSIVAEGTFAKGVALESTKLESTDENYISAMNKIADKEFDDEKVAVYDISLVKDNSKVQPDGKVKITMNAPFESENGYTTYHIKGETVEELETAVSDGKISFETSSFSYFVVVGNNPIDPNPNDPDKNFFAFADELEQGTLTVDGTDVKKGGLGLTLTENQQVELVARAGNGYKLLGWYKNSKSSGSEEKYEDLNVNPATFTYSGTEKMFVYARFDVITYEITVNLNGGDFKTGESIPETYNIESKTIVLPTPEKGTAEFLGWTDKNGNPVTEIAKGSMGDISLTAQWKTAVTKVNTIKNVAYAVDNITLEEEEKVFEGENLRIGIDDIPFGADSVYAFAMLKDQNYFQEFSYALALGSTWNHESVIELVVAEKDRNVTVGRIHSFCSAGAFMINATDWKIMHVEYEGKLESSGAALDSGWFDLLPNVEGYTDSDGKWIYQGDALNVYTNAQRVPVGSGAASPMGLDNYNGYQHGGKYDKMEFEPPVDSNGVCKYDKYYLDYYIIRSRTEDRKYDIIVSGDVEIYIGNKETGRAEKLLITSGNEKKRITITSPIVGEEDWYTTLLIIAKPGGKVIVYNGISPEGSASYAAADTALTNAVTIAFPSQSKKKRFLCV